MKRIYLFAVALILGAQTLATGREAKLARYPHYHQGRICFTYLGDIWTANEDGQNIQRITVHRARDVYPRFSPDGRWIAFSSDRNGSLDVFIVPAEGGTVKQLSFHSADDTVLGWTPDSRAVLFGSNRGDDFMGKLYTVSIDGGMERNTGADMGVFASYSPDGRRLALNRKAQAYWRKYYRGSFQSDVTVMDVAGRKFTDLTDFEGMDSWPMWSRDGHIYFVSDREGGRLTNIWRVPEAGGRAERVTAFKSGDVRWPAISADGKTIVFEHDFGIWKLDLSSKRATPIKLNIAAETQESLTEYRDFSSQVDDYDLAPSSRRIALSIHGEIFTAPIEEGDLRQVTDSPWRDKEPQYSPDGKNIAFISDRSGREELYVMASDGAGEPQKITNIDELKLSFAWSPDSQEIAFTSSENKLRKYSLVTKQITELASSKYGSIGAPDWSPDGKWIAYSKPDHTRSSDIYLIPSAGGEEKKATFDSYSELLPQFAPDGRKLFFIRVEGTVAGITPVQIHSVVLEREERDPNDVEDRPEPSEQTGDQTGDAAAATTRRSGPPRNQPPREIKLDWAGLKRRTRQLTRMPSAVTGYTIAPDSRTIVFATSEPASTRPVPVIYSIQDDGKRLTRIASGLPPTDESAQTPAAPTDVSGISRLKVARDGRTLFFQEARAVYEIGS